MGNGRFCRKQHRSKPNQPNTQKGMDTDMPKNVNAAPTEQTQPQSTQHTSVDNIELPKLPSPPRKRHDTGTFFSIVGVVVGLLIFVLQIEWLHFDQVDSIYLVTALTTITLVPPGPGRPDAVRIHSGRRLHVTELDKRFSWLPS